MQETNIYIMKRLWFNNVFSVWVSGYLAVCITQYMMDVCIPYVVPSSNSWYLYVCRLKENPWCYKRKFLDDYFTAGNGVTRWFLQLQKCLFVSDSFDLHWISCFVC